MIRITTLTARPQPLSRQIAAEHFAWAKAIGMSNHEILHSIGLPAPTHFIHGADVVDAIERTWLSMQMGWKAPRIVLREDRKAAAE